MSKKEDETKKEPCPVCGKMVSKTMGRKVHENSAFHKAALKRQQEGEKPPETKPPETKEENNQEEKPPETKPPEGTVSSGLAGDKKKSGEKDWLQRFCDWLFTGDDDE